MILSAGTLTPSFSENVTSYSAEVDYSVLSVIVTPIAADENATIELYGIAVDSGDSSDPIDLSVGANTITVEVTAEDTAITKTYTVVVTRLAELSHNANLSDLILSSGILSPVFDENTTSYTAQVSNAIASITVTPTVAGVNASVKVNNVAVNSGNASQAVNLSIGANTITVKVTAEDTTTTKTYTVVVTRLAAPSNNADLANLTLSQGTLSPAFTGNTILYTSQVLNAVSSVTVTPTVAGVNATVKVNTVTVVSGNASQAINLSVGPNTITVEVTAEDTTTIKIYTVIVTRNALYTVTYLGNGSTGGSPPSDPNSYENGNDVTVLGTGDLVKTDYAFAGWNTQADGNGTAYTVGATFVMGTANVVLYAKWGNA